MTMSQVKNMPRWALAAVLSVTLLPAGWFLSDHRNEDLRQSADIRMLADTVHRLSVVVDYNYKETDRTSTEVTKMRDTQRRLEVLLARMEERLDKDAG